LCILVCVVKWAESQMPFVGVGVAKSLNLLTLLIKMLYKIYKNVTLDTWVQALPLGDLLTVCSYI